MYVCSVMSDSFRPHGLEPARLLCPWNFPGENTGVSCHFLLQGIFPTRERTHVTFISCIDRGFFTTSATWKAPYVTLSCHEFTLGWRSLPKVKVKVKSRPTLCDPKDCSLPRFSVHGIFQARVLEWVAISFSRGYSQPRDRTWACRIVGRCFTV